MSFQYMNFAEFNHSKIQKLKGYVFFKVSKSPVNDITEWT